MWLALFIFWSLFSVLGSFWLIYIGFPCLSAGESSSLLLQQLLRESCHSPVQVHKRWHSSWLQLSEGVEGAHILCRRDDKMSITIVAREVTDFCRRYKKWWFWWERYGFTLNTIIFSPFLIPFYFHLSLVTFTQYLPSDSFLPSFLFHHKPGISPPFPSHSFLCYLITENSLHHWQEGNESYRPEMCLVCLSLEWNGTICIIVKVFCERDGDREWLTGSRRLSDGDEK